MARAIKQTPEPVAVGNAPTTSKELRERINAAWAEQCKIAATNGWCNDGTTILRDNGFVAKRVFNVTVTYDASIKAGYGDVTAENLKNLVEVGDSYGYKREGDRVVAVNDPGEEEIAPVDSKPLDEVIAKLHEIAKYNMRQYPGESRAGLELAIRNSLNAAGIPLPEKKERTYTFTVSGTSDMSAAELLNRVKEGYGFRDLERPQFEAQEVEAATA